MINDLEFVQRCLAKDGTAWDEFLDKYSRLIYSYILHVLNAKGCSPAKDISQDIFQEIICSLIKDDSRKLRTYKARNGCSLASWLRQVAVNATIDYLRVQKSAVSLDEEVGDDFSLKDVLPDNKAAAPDNLNSKERLASLTDCIEKLALDDKYFLQLHIDQGLRLQDLTGVLGLSRGAVDMQRSRILGWLRDCFKSKGFALDS